MLNEKEIGNVFNSLRHACYNPVQGRSQEISLGGALGNKYAGKSFFFN
jgi:hypothetical protein